MTATTARLSPRRLTVPALLALLAAGLLFAGIVVNMMVGPVSLPADEVIRVLWLRAIGAPVPDDLMMANAVVWELRVIRIFVAIGVGAALAVCGAAMQALFGNPLADPGIVGVSGGASLGAVAVIVFNLTFLGTWTLPLAAFVCGILTTALIYALAQPGQGGDSTRLLLVGIAINAFAAAMTGYLTYLASASELHGLVYWSMGSLSTASWSTLAVLLPLCALGLFLLMIRARQLDLLALGERQARHMGVDVTRLRLYLVVVCALLVAAAVSFAGTIGFVGLVVPHVVRLALGPGHRLLLPFSAAGGALLLVWADLGARNLDAPSEFPIGVLTASVGGPFFLWLIYRNRRQRVV